MGVTVTFVLIISYGDEGWHPPVKHSCDLKNVIWRDLEIVNCIDASGYDDQGAHCLFHVMMQYVIVQAYFYFFYPHHTKCTWISADICYTKKNSQDDQLFGDDVIHAYQSSVMLMKLIYTVRLLAMHCHHNSVQNTPLINSFNFS